MNKHLNNWLDKQDGLPSETSNKNIEKEIKLRKNAERDSRLVKIITK